MSGAGFPASDDMIETGRPSIPIAGASDLRALWKHALEEARAGYARIAAIPLESVSVASVLDEWDRISTILEDVVGPVAILNSVHTDRAVRDAGDEILVELSSFTTELFQDPALFERVHAVNPATDP